MRNRIPCQRDAGTWLATALRRRPFSACNKGNRRRLHAGKAKPKHLEADSATGSWTHHVTTEDQSGDQTQTHGDQRPFSWGTVLWRRGWYAYCSPCSACAQEWLCVALWYTDTETNFFVIMLAHSKNLSSKRCYIKKRRGANILCNSTQAMLSTASWGALIGVNSITGFDNISAFFGKGKLKAVHLLQPMEGTCELWRVSRERVISIQWEL